TAPLAGEPPLAGHRARDQSRPPPRRRWSLIGSSRGSTASPSIANAGSSTPPAVSSKPPFEIVGPVAARRPAGAAARMLAQVTHEASACCAALLAFALARMIPLTTTLCPCAYPHPLSYPLPRGGDAWPMRALRRNRPARPRTAAAPSQGEIRGRLRVLRRRTDRTLGGESENLRAALSRHQGVDHRGLLQRARQKDRTAAQGRQARG